MKNLAASLFLLFAALPSAAQSPIPPEEFLDHAVGKTLTFRDYGTGEFVGVEEFLNRTLTVWRDNSGNCVYGVVTIENGQLCFLYEALNLDPVCWWTFRDGDRLLVLLSKLVNGEIQEVASISDQRLSCPDHPRT